jgi:LysM repeat protein
MRVRFAVLVAALVTLVAPGAACADFVHVVAPGESLTSIAAADGLTIGQLAAANGLSPTAQLVSGTELQIPPQLGGPASSAGPAVGPSTSVAGDGDGDSDDAAAAPAGDGDSDTDDGGVTATAGPAAAGGAGAYVVQPGDTLSAIAARAGIPLDQLAAANGLDPAAPLLAGTVLQLTGAGTPGASSATAGPSQVSTPATPGAAAASQPVGQAAEGSPVNPPYPTPQTVSPTEVGSIAAANGVPPALAQAIAYQESGFNNAAVSAADARGVMQILPGTWNWIQQTLVPGASPLAPASASDNVRGGVLLLRSLLNATGGNPALAAAGYYQGLPSVEQNGMYPSTQQYVGDVLALEQRFAGGG